MGIVFIKNNFVSSLVRPKGYNFPVGLSVDGVPTLSVDYLIVAGGGHGTSGGGGAGGFLTGTGYKIGRAHV